MAKIIGNTSMLDEGEKYVINTLKNFLPEEYSIFYKPFLNGEEPQIVILKRHGGIYLINISQIDVREIIEIKKTGKLRYIKLKDNKSIKLPTDMIIEEKLNLFNYHIESLFEEKLRNVKSLSLVGCGIVFIKNTSKNVNEYFEIKENYIDIYGADQVRKLVDNIKRNFSYSSKYFKDEMYFEIEKKLLSSQIIFPDQQEYYLSKRQKELIISKEGKTKIKGIAGSGKTVILANRVVNHISRIKKEQDRVPKVLILTFNITLRNYILENIQRISKENIISYVQVIHYHKFIMDKANKNSIINIDFNNPELFSEVKGIKKYDGIFIDEIQDYKLVWQNLLINTFLKDNGEYVVFGDEKQNIYDRELEVDKSVRTNIKGTWNKLKESYRGEGELVEISMKFQREFLNKKYEPDEFFVSQRDFLGLEQRADYLTCTVEDLEEVSREIINILQRTYVDINKTVIISSTVELLRKVESCLGNHNTKNITTFETEEEYNNLIKRIESYSKKESYTEFILSKEIGLIRRNRKYNFASKRGLKISTIHSFKGLQEETVILIINDSNRNSAELIYTAITRCRKYLIIIDCSFEKKYQKFFLNLKEGNAYESR